MFGNLQVLKGKTLRSISRAKKPRGAYSEAADTITFHCANGDYLFEAEGDCCSQTFIESVEGPQAGVILDVLEPHWGEDDADRYREEKDGEMKFYKATLVLEGAGHLDVEYRNESNGYYGGTLELRAAPSESVSNCSESPKGSP